MSSNLSPAKRNNTMRIATQKEKFTILGVPGDLDILSKAKIAIPLKLSWKLGYTVRAFTCHKMLVPHIEAVYKKIALLDPAFIIDSGMDIFGGCYELRAVRSAKGEKPPFSTHSWGAAVDCDNHRNGLWTKAPGANLSDPKYKPIHDIWNKHGFVNLGHVIGRDYMHYEASFELISNPSKFL
jgi:hypothetical protein